MKRADYEIFEKLVGQLESTYDEIAVLSKKSPNDAVNKFKLAFINTLLLATNELLGAKYRPFADFAQFDTDSVPQNSDVVFILSQYLQCCEKLRADNIIQRIGTWCWKIDATKREGADDLGFVYIPTVRPKRLRE